MKRAAFLSTLLLAFAFLVAAPPASAQDIVCVNSGTTCIYLTSNNAVCVGSHLPSDTCTGYVYLNGSKVCYANLVIVDACYWAEVTATGVCLHEERPATWDVTTCAGTGGLCADSLLRPTLDGEHCFVAVAPGGHLLCIDYQPATGSYAACVG